MKKIIIVQSLPVWITILKEAVNEQIPEIAPSIIYTGSFNHAIDLVTKEEELLVICCDMFHDEDSEHYGNVTEKLPDSEKNGNNLAKLIKEINKNAKVWVFSEYPPESFVYLDGFISKKDIQAIIIRKLMRLIKKF